MIWVWLSRSCSSALDTLVVCLPTRVKDFQQLMGVLAAQGIQDEAGTPHSFTFVYLRVKTGTKRKEGFMSSEWKWQYSIFPWISKSPSACLLGCRIVTFLIFSVVKKQHHTIEPPNYLITLCKIMISTHFIKPWDSECMETAGTSLAGILWRCIAFFCVPLITSARSLWCWCSGLIGLILLLQQHQSAVNKSLFSFSFFLLSTKGAF